MVDGLEGRFKKNEILSHIRNFISSKPNQAVVLSLLFALFGTCHTMFFQLINECVVKSGTNLPPSRFNYPIFSTLIMTLGETGVCGIVLVFYVFQSFFTEKRSTELKRIGSRIINSFTIDSQDVHDPQIIFKRAKKRDITYFHYLFLSILDLSATILAFYGLQYTSASIYNVLSLGGITLVFISFFKVVFFKRKLFPHQLLGIIFVVISTILISLVLTTPSTNSTAYSQLKTERHSSTLGVVLLILSALLLSLECVSLEYVLQHCTPFHTVGIGGLCELGLTNIVLFASYFITDSENVVSVITQLFNASFHPLYTCIIFALMSSFCYNLCWHMCIKLIGADKAQTVDSLRTVIIYAIQLCRAREQWSFLEFSALCLLFVGVFLYNRILEIPVYDEWYCKTYEKQGDKIRVLVRFVDDLKLKFEEVVLKKKSLGDEFYYDGKEYTHITNINEAVPEKKTGLGICGDDREDIIGVDSDKLLNIDVV